MLINCLSLRYSLLDIIRFIPIIRELYKKYSFLIKILLSKKIPLHEIQNFIIKISTSQIPTSSFIQLVEYISFYDIKSNIDKIILLYNTDNELMSLLVSITHNIPFNKLIEYFNELEPYYKIPENRMHITSNLQWGVNLGKIVGSLKEKLTTSQDVGVD